MAEIAVDTPTMQALARRVDAAIRVAADVEGRLADSGTRAGDFRGPSAPVGAALRTLLHVVGTNARGSADDLARLRDSLLMLAELWDQVEHGTFGRVAP